MKKISLILLSLLFLLNSCVYAAGPYGFMGFVPAPELKTPRSEVVDLKGQSSLTFMWGRHRGMNGLAKYYEFRLYKGNKTLNGGLIFKKTLRGNIYQLKIPSTMFEANAVYTWSLKLCYGSIGKSKRSIGSFKIISI